MSKEDPECAGVEKTVLYMRCLGKEHKDLIKEYAQWALLESPIEALEVTKKIHNSNLK